MGHPLRTRHSECLPTPLIGCVPGKVVNAKAEVELFGKAAPCPGVSSVLVEVGSWAHLIRSRKACAADRTRAGPTIELPADDLHASPIGVALDGGRRGRYNIIGRFYKGNRRICSSMIAIDRILATNNINALVRGHQDLSSVLKLFRKKEVMIGVDQMKYPLIDQLNNPLDWKTVVAFQAPILHMNDYGPVFTLSTASGSKCNVEGCVEIVL